MPIATDAAPSRNTGLVDLKGVVPTDRPLTISRTENEEALIPTEGDGSEGYQSKFGVLITHKLTSNSTKLVNDIWPKSE